MKTWKSSKRSWYSELQIPGLPPPWIFFPVWMTLYGLITASAFLYWRDDTHSYYDIVIGFLVGNLILNKLWSLFFFSGMVGGWGLAFIDVLCLDGSGIAIVVLMGLDKSFTAMGLFIPYVVWCLYATYLNGMAAFKYGFIWNIATDYYQNRLERSERRHEE
jgi:tryptophan-rich sensory protein